MVSRGCLLGGLADVALDALQTKDSAAAIASFGIAHCQNGKHRPTV